MQDQVSQLDRIDRATGITGGLADRLDLNRNPSQEELIDARSHNNPALQVDQMVAAGFPSPWEIFSDTARGAWTLAVGIPSQALKEIGRGMQGLGLPGGKAVENVGQVGVDAALSPHRNRRPPDHARD